MKIIFQDITNSCKSLQISIIFLTVAINMQISHLSNYGNEAADDASRAISESNCIKTGQRF